MNRFRIRTHPILTLLSKTPHFFQVQQPKTTATGTTASKRAKVTNAAKTTTASTKKDAPAKGTKTKSGTDSKPAKDISTTEKQQPLSATGLTNDDGTRISVWLMKSEPDTFSIDDLINSKDSSSHWDGVVSSEGNSMSIPFGERTVVILTLELRFLVCEQL